MRKIKCLILGGGQGKRLFPLTRDRSKPAVPIAGKYRLIDISISNCINSNLRNIFVLTQFNSASLNHHIHHTYRFDYFTGTYVEILAAEQTTQNTQWFQGTADAVRKNLSHLDLRDEEDILILSGDHLYKMDYHELVNLHRQRNADLTVSAVPVPRSVVNEFGILKFGDTMRIESFSEKPSSESELRKFRVRGRVNKNLNLGNRELYFASMGVYVFKVPALIRSLETSDDVDFGKQVIPHAIGQFHSFGFVFTGYWRDIGTIKSFYEENIAMTYKNPKFNFFSEEKRVFTHPRFLPPAKIEDSQIQDSLITEGCLISGAKIKNSVIGLRSIIKKGARIKESIIMGTDFYEEPESEGNIPIGIGEYTIIEKAIVDKNARIGGNVVIKNLGKIKNSDNDNYYVRDGIVIIPKNAVIPDNTRI
jgi:glucose-1-phosphate adenylyltransferase